MKHRIVLQVDSSECFDRMHEFGTDAGAIGIRLMVPFLTGELPGTIDRIGLAMYGVTVESVEKITALRASTEEGKTATPSEFSAEEERWIADATQEAVFRDRAAKLVEGMIKQEPWSKHQWARTALGIAGSNIRRGRYLTDDEKFANLVAAVEEDDPEFAQQLREGAATPSVTDEEAGR